MNQMLASILKGQEEMSKKMTSEREETTRNLIELGQTLDIKIKSAIAPIQLKMDETVQKLEDTDARLTATLASSDARLTASLASSDARLAQLTETVARLTTRAPQSPQTPVPPTSSSPETSSSWASRTAATVTGSTSSPPPKPSEGENARKRKLYLERTGQVKVGLTKEAKIIMEKAGRTISLFPVTSREVESIRKEMEEERNEEVSGNLYQAALRCAVGEFLTNELKVTSEEWEKLVISEIFTPKGPHYNTVYVTFPTRDLADDIKSHSRFLREGLNLRVGRHVPWLARDRHSFFESEAKRQRDQGRKTRVEQQEFDYVLLIRPRDEEEARWTELEMTADMPPFAAANQARAGSRKSPTKGRGRKLRTEPPPRRPRLSGRPASTEVSVSGSPTSTRKHARSPASAAQVSDPSKRLRPEEVFISSTPTDEVFENSLVLGEEQNCGEGGRRDSLVSVNSVTFREPSTRRNLPRSSKLPTVL